MAVAHRRSSLLREMHSTGFLDGRGLLSWRPSLLSALVMTLGLLLVSAALVLLHRPNQTINLSGNAAWLGVSKLMRDPSKPCLNRPRSQQPGCELVGNIVATRRQLRDCGFEAVVVVPLAHVQSPQEDVKNITTLQTNYENLPFPVVPCVIKPGLTTNPESFFSSRLDDPPCVRPSVGRDDVAYLSFILQNWDHLPSHMLFMHGHETSWHQDSNTTLILREFCERRLSSDMYVSLSNMVSPDWRRIRCVIPGTCSSAKKQRHLDNAWGKYFERFLGPLPADLTHFCCAQFAVSRSRVLLRPRQLFASALTFSLTEFPGIYDAMPCWGRCELPGAIMEVLWPHIFGAKVPLNFDERLKMGYPPEMPLPSDAARAYRYAWSVDDWLQKPLTA